MHCIAILLSWTLFVFNLLSVIMIWCCTATKVANPFLSVITRPLLDMWLPLLSQLAPSQLWFSLITLDCLLFSALRLIFFKDWAKSLWSLLKGRFTSIFNAPWSHKVFGCLRADSISLWFFLKVKKKVLVIDIQ